VEKFFNTIRETIFGGKLSQWQVDGIHRLLIAWAKYGDGNIQRGAKVFATATWETGRTMQPVKETQRGSVVPSDTTVQARLDKAWAEGKLPWVKKNYWKDGYFGRGDVQLTHETNYAGPARVAVLKEFGVDILTHPELALRGDISAFILVRGCLEGWFTGKKLSDYIDDLDEPDAQDHEEYMEARRVVNGRDRAREIADLAIKWERAFKLLPRPDVAMPGHPPVPTTAPAPKDAPHGRPTAPEPGLFVAVFVVLLLLYLMAGVFGFVPLPF